VTPHCPVHNTLQTPTDKQGRLSLRSGRLREEIQLILIERGPFAPPRPVEAPAAWTKTLNQRYKVAMRSRDFEEQITAGASVHRRLALLSGIVIRMSSAAAPKADGADFDHVDGRFGKLNGANENSFAPYILGLLVVA
jgi:hypothetical protein